MNKSEFPIWGNLIEERIIEINRVRNQIQNVKKHVKNKTLTQEDFETLYENIRATLSNWSGQNSVGQEADKRLIRAFQGFHEGLIEFLKICKECDNPYLQEFAKSAMYNGTLYRYLGHEAGDEHSDEKIEPIYNDRYVSWTKNPDCSYLKSKLYGTITVLTCEVKEPLYGIDLEAFGASGGDEKEVVFPTIKETITNIEYIDE